MRGSTSINNIKEEKLIQLDKKKEQLAEEQIEKVQELMENINELEANIKELAKYNEETKAESAKTMANYIKDRLEEFKADGIICKKKEKYYLITLEQIGRKSKNFNICYNHIIIFGLDLIDGTQIPKNG